MSGPAARRLRKRLETEIEKLRRLEGRRSRWSSLWSYWIDGREIVHFHRDGSVDVRLTRAAIRERRAALVADPRVGLGAPSRDWVSVTLASPADVPLAVELVKVAIAANRAR